MSDKRIYIGTSGWSYKHWRGNFYPENLKVKDEFQYYLKHFNSVEINSTFYHLPKKQTFINWKNSVPDNFKFVLKASRFITHMKKLRDFQESLSLFFEHAFLLEDKLEAILFQLPPGLRSDEGLLESFLKELPETCRFAFEFRNPDWYRPEIINLLNKYYCAFCIYELDGHMSPIEVTTDFVYLRLHGPGRKYQGDYSHETLMAWADKSKEWLKSKDVFIFFDNDQNGYAAFNALKIKEFIEE